MKKNLAVAIVASALTLGGAAGVGVLQSSVSADTAPTTSSPTKNDPMSSLVDALVKKFNLKKADVQAVFDANHTQMDAQRESEVKTQLAQLVKDGKLTQTQADAITAKRAELQKTRGTNRTSMNSKTETERKTAMDAERTALDKWLTDNNIPTEYRYLVFGGGHGRGGPDSDHGMRGGPNHSSTTSTSSSSSTTN